MNRTKTASDWRAAFVAALHKYVSSVFSFSCSVIYVESILKEVCTGDNTYLKEKRACDLRSSVLSSV